MSRKPIFPGDLKSSQFIARQADTRVNTQIKKPEFNINFDKSPFSGFSTANVSLEQSRSEDYSVKNDELMKKISLQDAKLNEFQNQLDVLRNMIVDIKHTGYQDKLSKQILLIQDTLSHKIENAQEELFKQQQTFQNTYYRYLYIQLRELQEEVQKQYSQMHQVFLATHNAKMNEFKISIDQSVAITQFLETKTKQIVNKTDKADQELDTRLTLLEEQIIAQFKTFQTAFQDHIVEEKNQSSDNLRECSKMIQQSIQKLQDELDRKQNSQKQINLPVIDHQSNLQIIEIQHTLKQIQQQFILQQSISEDNNQIIQNLENQFKNQQSKLPIIDKQLTDVVEITLNNQTNIDNLRSQVNKLIFDLQSCSEQTQKQLEDTRKSYQDLLFSFKQFKPSDPNYQSQTYQRPEVTSHNVQVYSFEDDGTESLYTENKFIEVAIRTESDVVETGTVLDKESFLQRQAEFVSIADVPYQEPQGQEIDFVPQEEEVTYQLDDQGFLLDENGNYILDDNGQMIQLTESQIQFLRQQKMVEGD